MAWPVRPGRLRSGQGHEEDETGAARLEAYGVKTPTGVAHRVAGAFSEMRFKENWFSAILADGWRTDVPKWSAIPLDLQGFTSRSSARVAENPSSYFLAGVIALFRFLRSLK